MNCITVADTPFLPHVQSLLVSLQRVNDADLLIFCDDTGAFAPLADLGRCQVRHLPEIVSLGVKRAKFSAYKAANAELGDFLFLDSDIVVLESLAELGKSGLFEAAPDDLSACDFITDKDHPWPQDPELVNSRYINSGVMFMPAHLRDCLDEMHRRSLVDSEWLRYIIPGKLYDNHFLCAHIHKLEIPVSPIDPNQYNWQGFLQKGELQVVRSGNSLVNKRSGHSLKLVHFAGTRDINQFLCTLPADVASLIAERSEPYIDTPARSLRRFHASFSHQFSAPLTDQYPVVVYGVLQTEMLNLAQGGFTQSFENKPSYLQRPEALLSIATSVPNSQVLWNGLKCGGAYLEGDEYNHLSELIARANIRTALEFGAGETSILFQRAGVRSTAIEANEGPWLDRAKEAGCRVALVPFSFDLRRFDDDRLRNALALMESSPDLLFVDSPIGTRNRRNIPAQVCSMARPKYVLVHDAHRDAQNIFAYQTELGLQLIDYLPSSRGLVLLGFPEADHVPARPEQQEAVLEGVTGSLAVEHAPSRVEPGETFKCLVTLRNLGDVSFSSRYSRPVHVSYHWFSESGQCLVYDGLRTALPFDILPGSSATFPVNVAAPEAEGAARLQLTVVQEYVSWFDGPSGIAAQVDVVIARAEHSQTDPARPSRSVTVHRPRISENSAHAITTDIAADSDFMRFYESTRMHTITSLERMYSTYQAIQYVAGRRIPGDFVECGVWMGGNCMLAALALLHLKSDERSIWLYDTFEGMTRPGEFDVRHDNTAAMPIWLSKRTDDEASEWWSAPESVVLNNMFSTGYPRERIRLVKGRVEDTIPANVPDQVSVLRLDTDWYASTRHEMEHLFDRLVPGGVLIVDDYGWWRGSRQAVDEYLAKHGFHLLLSRIDPCGARMAVKV